MLRIIDRMAYENKDEEMNPIFEQICKLDTIPTKEAGFVKNISEFCHTSTETAKKLFDEMQQWKKKQIQECRNYRHDRVDSIIILYSQRSVLKELKKEAKKVERQQKSKELSQMSQKPTKETEKKDSTEKKEVTKTAKGSKYEKQVAKLIRQNLDVTEWWFY